MLLQMTAVHSVDNRSSVHINPNPKRSNGHILAGHIGLTSRRHLLSSLLTKTAACDLLSYAKYFTSSHGHTTSRSDDIQNRNHRSAYTRRHPLSMFLHLSDHISLSSHISRRIEREVDIHLVEMGLGPLPHDCSKGRSISHQGPHFRDRTSSTCTGPHGSHANANAPHMEVVNHDTHRMVDVNC
jgi:hypothetical protein